MAVPHCQVIVACITNATADLTRTMPVQTWAEWAHGLPKPLDFLLFLLAFGIFVILVFCVVVLLMEIIVPFIFSLWYGLLPKRWPKFEYGRFIED